MLRASLIRRLSAGIYTWLPLGLRVMRKVEAIVREEDEPRRRARAGDAGGAARRALAAIAPLDEYGPELLRFKDRHERDFVIQPTSEEVITDLARNELKSYRRLPVHFVPTSRQSSGDERRPRFGVMRFARVHHEGRLFFPCRLRRTSSAEYRNMHDTYSRIFTRLGLKFRAVAADTGAIGGTGSHEFHVLADSGEDAIAFSPQSDYAANVELAEAVSPGTRAPAKETMKKVPTPGKTTCEEVAQLLGLPLQRNRQGGRRDARPRVHPAPRPGRTMR